MHLPSLLIAALTANTVFAANAAGTKPQKTVVSAFGVQVTNLTRSLDFYTKPVGLKDTGLHLETELWDERVLTSDGGSGFLLMNFKPPRPAVHLPVKLVLSVDSVKNRIDKIRAAGYKILVEPDPVFEIMGAAEDPDGYTIGFTSE